jgi:outer membrane protein
MTSVRNGPPYPIINKQLSANNRASGNLQELFSGAWLIVDLQHRDTTKVHVNTRIPWVLVLMTLPQTTIAWPQQTPPQLPLRRITMAEAEQIALRNHPRVASADLNARAAGEKVKEARAAFYPTFSLNFTGVGAEHGSVVEAGSLTTSSLYSRAAGGVVLNQLITDFGRTSDLAREASQHAGARTESAAETRAEVVLEVRRSYSQALGADSVLKVARETVEYRRTQLRQMQTLAESSMRSTLDVSFAQVNLSDAELTLVRAENDAQAGRARLGAAIGTNGIDFDLVDQQLPPAPVADPETLVRKALHERPDLAALRLDHDAALSLARAEKRLSSPTVNLLAAAGGAPAIDGLLRPTYGAAGVNVSIPVFNGGLFAARRSEAEFRAQAAERDVDDLVLRIARDVRMAWLGANYAWGRLDLTARMVDQANQTVRLAQARYDLGLGAIVELNQAQLSQTTAQINAAAARYEYITRVAELDFVTGNLTGSKP